MKATAQNTGGDRPEPIRTDKPHRSQPIDGDDSCWFVESRPNGQFEGWWAGPPTGEGGWLTNDPTTAKRYTEDEARAVAAALSYFPSPFRWSSWIATEHVFVSTPKVLTERSLDGTLARLRKAIALADLCDASGITARDAQVASEDDWKLAAQAAQVKPPSAETQRLVVELLTAREAARARMVRK